MRLQSLICNSFRITLNKAGILESDYVRLYVRGGTGGNGILNYGGVGGAGGNVVFKASQRVSLKNLVERNISRRFIAESGRDSRKLVIVGAKGADLIVPVPTGITISSDEGLVLGQLNRDKEELVVAKGGEGGGPKRGESSGERPKGRSLRLDLKLLADVGLVGFPNAGKSTLLKAISRAKPLITSFPFTTLKPQIGIVEYPDFRKISMADLPGLVEGAYRNVGMGHRFLKHVERTPLLLFVVDHSGFQLNAESPFRNAFETVMLLNRELELYNPELLYRPALMCINKLDLPNGKEKCEQVEELLRNAQDNLHLVPEELRPRTKLLKFLDFVCISGRKQLNIEVLKEKIRNVLDQIDDEKKGRLRRNETELVAENDSSPLYV